MLAPSATLDAAQRVIAAAVMKAEDLAVDVCIAVTDGGGHLLAMARIVLDAGAPGLTIHPRPDERHIRGADVEPAKAAANAFPPGFVSLSLGETAMKDRKAI